jgi:hypothetical protein
VVEPGFAAVLLVLEELVDDQHVVHLVDGVWVLADHAGVPLLSSARARAVSVIAKP